MIRDSFAKVRILVTFVAVLVFAAQHIEAADSAPEMCPVPAGEFTTSTGVQVYLDAYSIGKYEVTNAQYCEFLNAGGNDDHWHTEMAPEIEHTDTYQPVGGFENRPVRHVTWFDAVAFCDWRCEAEGLLAGSYHLPTEAQWEKAAGWDPVEQKLWTYPICSDIIDCSKVNYNSCMVGHTTDVGSYDPWKSCYRCYDMSGNVWEWCQDWHGGNYPTGNFNPEGAATGVNREIRGGAWISNAPDCEAGYRNQANPSSVITCVGFRIARSGRVHTLTVQSTPVTDVNIGGDKPGITDYSAACEDQEVVNLTAPPFHVSEGARYCFVEWTGHGTPDANSVQVTMDADKEVTAVYEPCPPTLCVQSVPVTGVGIAGNRPGDTDYCVECSFGEEVAVTAPETFSAGDLDYCFIEWTGDGTPNGNSVQVTMDDDKTVVAQYALCQRWLTVSSQTTAAEVITGVSITGDKPGVTGYDVLCNDQEVAQLCAPWNVVLGGNRYRFVRWIVDGLDQADGQTCVQVIMDTPHTVVAVYREVTGRLILKGPVERGEEPSLGAGGTFSVDVYLGDVYDLAGMQAGLKFLDQNSSDAGFRIATIGGNPDFGGQAIQFNDALWPNIFPLYTDDRTPFGFISLEGNKDISEETLIFSVTYEYGPDARGQYDIVSDPLVTELAGGDRNAIPFDTAPGSVIIEAQVLTVRSVPVAGIGITGSRPGTTGYTWRCADDESVQLCAPENATIGEVPYGFARWTIDGAPQADGQQCIDLVMSADRTVEAEYVRMYTLTVKSAPFGGVTVSGDRPGTTEYSASCREGQTVSLSAPASITYNDRKFFFLYWFVNGSPRPRYQNPVSEKILRDTEVVAVYDVTIPSDANADCVVNILDLIKVRNDLGKRCSTSP